MNQEKIPEYPLPRLSRMIFGRLAPLSRRDIMPARKSCVAPAITQPTGMMRKTISPNLIPRITPITGPTPAMFKSWIIMFFHFGRTT